MSSSNILGFWYFYSIKNETHDFINVPSQGYLFRRGTQICSFLDRKYIYCPLGDRYQNQTLDDTSLLQSPKTYKNLQSCTFLNIPFHHFH